MDNPEYSITYKGSDENVAKKLMSIVIFDMSNVTLGIVDPSGKTVTAHYYSKVLF